MEMNLKIELDEDNSFGSRGELFGKKSVKWISKLLNEETKNKSVLDLGCGTGVIAREFYEAGFDVTGVDISIIALKYARSMNKNINYIYGDYFEINFNRTFDIIYLGYCALGMYNKQKRYELIKKCYNHLNDGGLLILDVFSKYKFSNFCDYKIWEIDMEKNQWATSPYLHFLNFIVYPEDNTYLDRHIIFKDSVLKIYNRWNHVFDINELRDSLNHCGFTKLDFYNDICGLPYAKGGDTICVIAHKYLS